MKLFAKLLALFRQPPPPAVPPALYSDAEFMEAVAKLARERYAQPPAPSREAAPPATGPVRATA